MSSSPIRIGGYQGPGSILTAGLARLADTLEAEAGLPVARDFDATAGGATARALFEGLETGDWQIGYMASGYLTASVPELAVIDLPFTVQSRPAAHAALDGAAGAMLREAVEGAANYRLLGFWDNGFRHVTNRLRPVRSPADAGNMSLRTLDNRIYVETLTAMGFGARVIDVSQLRAAVAEQRVDAQENPIANTIAFDIHHHHKHISLTGHFFGALLLLAHRDWFDALPPATRAAVTGAAAAATAHQRALAAAEDARGLAAMEAAGVQVVAGDALDRAAFRAACAGVIETERDRLPPALVAAYAGG